MNLTRRKMVGWIVVIAALCLAWFFYSLFGPNPPIIVSRETTYITEPLGEDGLPDYVAYWVQRASEGVTPENNAAVLIWQALWPGELEPEQQLPMAKALGLAEVPSTEDAIVSPFDGEVQERVAAEIAENYPLPPETPEEFWQNLLREQTAVDAILTATDRPWTSDQLPALAEWVEKNQKLLDLLVEAFGRPRYYSPLRSVLNADDDDLISNLFPDMQLLRNAARCLKIRAMHSLAQGSLSDAWTDLRACHRLARLWGHELTLVEQLVAIAIEQVACSGTQQLLHHQDLTEPLARQILAELSAMPPAVDLGTCWDEGERIFFLDVVTRVGKGKQTVASMWADPLSEGEEGPGRFEACNIDWNVVLKSGNGWYDRLAAASRLRTRAERTAALQEIDRDIDRLDQSIRGPVALVGSAFSRRLRSTLMADTMGSLFLPAINAASTAADRGLAKSQLTRVVAALAGYRARHGEYPETLAALVPDILPEMPLDLYSEKPFFYQRKPDGGYLLYSVDQNGVDDGGTDMGGEIVGGEWVDEPQDVDWNKSDIVVRVPVPPFRLPEPPVVAE